MLSCGKIGVFGMPATRETRHTMNDTPLPLTIPADDLCGTRSSHRWKRPPSQIDTLNARIILPTAGPYGIPPLEPCDLDPQTIAPYDRRAERRAADCIHFFRDDYRFERVWRDPERTIEHIAEVGATFTPDFSCWLEMPMAAQLWQVYRSRWLGAYWQYHGIHVVPTITWSNPECFAWILEGLPEHSTVAMAATRLRDPENRRVFLASLRIVLERLRPARILVYGHLPRECDHLELPEIHEYPTVSDQMRARLRKDKPWAPDGQELPEPREAPRTAHPKSDSPLPFTIPYAET